jgi:UDP-glucose 4-epimerase
LLSDIKPIFQGVDTVVHAACTAYEGLSVFSPDLVVKNTMQITASTLSAAVSEGVQKFVFLSSMARYGTQKTSPFTESMTPNPQDPYGIAKYSSELLVRNICETQGLKFVILVPHNIIGPRQKYDDPFRNVASIMINRMLQSKQPIIYGDGEQKRCFSFIEDVVAPIVKAVNSNVVDGQVVNIGPDEELISINSLAKIIAKQLDFELQPIYHPARPQEVFLANCSADKARVLLGYNTTTSLEDGIKKLVEWIKVKGPKTFQYHLPIEIKNTKTPKTWTDELI